MLDQTVLVDIKRELINRKHELLDKNVQNHQRIGEEEYSTELSNYDNHPGDSGSELYEKEKDIALNQYEQKELKAINEALVKMKLGTYGKCEKCGETIDQERLQAIPTTQFCVEHANHETASYPEGEHSMGRLEMDDADAWHTVERYGTSESPSDFSSDQNSYDQLTDDHDSNDIDQIESYSNEDKI
ncbi:TraR/DksA C4-type zinc finger protein [Amphibacillus cookii]|uniref:TraR/DksA C4-type zinc finger protein n=1 Tax=Amphibacillus cookii TaxID=767787 RepID=UPI00195BA52F|nr:TraR/DksA C4-type zinc finger protein [Amphibacillus cookii]MBM7542395.1 RNA polymerase-binding transcription factor DksA [Amphibacillus cookii]